MCQHSSSLNGLKMEKNYNKMEEILVRFGILGALEVLRAGNGLVLNTLHSVLDQFELISEKCILSDKIIQGREI